MLITLAYLYIYLMKWRQKSYNAMKRLQLMNVIRDSLRFSSISLQKHGAIVAPSIKNWSSNLQISAKRDSAKVRLLFETTDCRIYAIEPKFNLLLSGWTRYLFHESHLDSAATDSKNIFYIILELLKYNKDIADFEDRTTLHETKLEDLVHLVAWKSGHPFQVVAECTENSFCELAKCFIDSTLVTQEMLQVTSVTSIDIKGQPDNLIENKSPLRSSAVSSHEVITQAASCSNANNAVNGNTDDARLLSVSQKVPFSFHLIPGHVEELSENFSDSDCAGEAPAEPLEDLAPEMLTPVTRRANLQGKPPNILVYCGKKDSARLFENVRSVFSQCLNTDRYTIYHLKHDHVKTLPWLDNTAMLIISSEKVYDGVDEVFMRYFLGGGTVVSFVSLFDAKFVSRVQSSPKGSIMTICYEHWKDSTFIGGRHVYEQNLRSLLYDVTLTAVATEKQKDNAVIVEAVHETNGGVALLSQVYLDKDPSEMAISTDIFTILKQSNASRFEILRSLFRRLGLDCEHPALPSLTPIVLLANNPRSKQLFFNSLVSRLKDGHLVSKDVTLHFIKDNSDLTNLSVLSSLIPVISDADKIPVMFDFALYKENLKSKVLGNVMFYADVIATTMNLFESLMFSIPSEIGLVAVARRQTAGLGRGGNVWLSPPGCAMFSVHVRVPLISWLGERIPFLQHIMSLAVVMAVREKPGYKNIDLQIKWPNDIYFGAKMKLGGILVKSSIMSNVIHANIGCGVNVANKDPTICINDLIQIANENSHHGASKLNLLTVEEVVARSITTLEQLIDQFQADGPNNFLEMYYKYWLHGNQLIQLNREGGPQATVIGLDDYGYLLVRLSNGRTQSVQPDGNSFDMMRNLIVPKSN